MEKFTKKIQGSISMFLSMIILLLVILEGFLIDGSKVLAGKMFMSNAGDMALNAGLTYYEEALRDIYGLFATCETEGELTKNLKVHFQKTLGESVGYADEKYVDQLLEYVGQALANGWGGEEPSQLLNLKTEGFEAKGVDHSQLANSYVIKSQILEYMKYRGPASLGYGMLEKIHTFKELDKQQKTMEGKLNYEEKMSDVQKACEDAYENIEQYNRLLEGGLAPVEVENLSLEINKNMREAILATWCYSAVKQEYVFDKNWEKNNGASGRNVEAAIRNCRNLDNMWVIYQASESGLKENDSFSSHPYGSMAAIKVTLGYIDSYENFRTIYTTWQNYQEYFKEEMERLEEERDNLDEDEDGSWIDDAIKELEDERNRYEKAYNDAKEKIDKFPLILDKARSVLPDDINNRMKIAVNGIKKLVTDAQKLQDLGKGGKDALDGVLKAMKELKDLGDNWQGSINDLSDGDIKTSMQLDYSNKAEKLDEDKIRILQERLTRGIEYGETLSTAAKEVQAITHKLHEGEKPAYAEWLRIKLKGTAYGTETHANNMAFNNFDVTVWTENAEQSQCMKDPSCTIYLVGSGAAVTSGEDVRMDLTQFKENMDNISARNDEFFKYLERVCPKEETLDGEAKKEAEEAKRSLLEKGKSENTQPDKPLPSLQADVTGGSGSAAGNFTETGTGATDKVISQNAKNNTSGSADFISGVGSLLESGRDKLYLSEYSVEMFSYYTIDKMKASDQVTLSGYPINAANNQMYQAEVEYILWGNPSGDKDVQYTMATIFGIRFLLNSLYAFTGDPEIRSVSLAFATSIAGWTGFGVPLVQSVIILGFALAETALDMKELKAGKSVPIYKSTSTWCVKPAALLKEGAKQALIDAGTNAAQAAKTRLFEKLDQLTEKTKEEFRTQLTEFTDNAIDDIVSTATAGILNPMQEMLTGLVNVVVPSREAVEVQVADALSKLKNQIASEADDSIVKLAKETAFDCFEKKYGKQLVDLIVEIQNQNGLSNKEITDKIYAAFEGYGNSMRSAIENEVKPKVTELSDEVERALDSTNETLQKNTSDALDKMVIRINCGISFAKTPTEKELKKSVEIDGSKSRASSSSAMTMNYKEYLWLFIAVKSVVQEEQMLKRIGNLIQANLAASDTAPAPDFDITSAYTMIEIDATAELPTTFFAMPVPSAGGSVVWGQDRYSIGYRGVLGY